MVAWRGRLIAMTWIARFSCRSPRGASRFYGGNVQVAAVVEELSTWSAIAIGTVSSAASLGSAISRRIEIVSSQNESVRSNQTQGSRIRSARLAIGDDGKRQAAIQTVHGRGYRFVADLD